MPTMIRRLASLPRDQRGAVSPMMMFLLIPIVGIMSLAGEASFWFMEQRALQNAADSAAIAAATNGDDTYYADEVYAVAGQYGLKQNANVTVTPAKVLCPGAATGTDCFQVTIDLNVPLYLTQIVGYQGDLLLADGRRGKTIRAIAIGRPVIPGEAFCMISLGQNTGDGITFNGSQGAQTPGCDYKSNTDIKCNGIQIPPADSAWYSGSAVPSSSSCGPAGEDHPLQPVTVDPFDYLNDSPSPIPNDPCSGTYNYEKGATPLATANLISAAWTGTKTICGDARLTATSAIQLTGAETKLVIYNGGLDLNGKTLQSLSNAGLTIIFAKGDGSTAGVTPKPTFTGSGTLDIAAPTTGDTSGVAVIQDIAYTQSNNTNISLAGNWTFKVTGLVYAPHGAVTIAGAIDKSTNGSVCMAVVSASVTISGTGEVYEDPTSACAAAGLAGLPQVPGTREALVQ
jgi:hypothetical protein